MKCPCTNITAFDAFCAEDNDEGGTTISCLSFNQQFRVLAVGTETGKVGRTVAVKNLQSGVLPSSLFSTSSGPIKTLLLIWILDSILPNDLVLGLFIIMYC